MNPNIVLPATCHAIISRLTQQGFHAYAVGGCIRDSLMGRAPHDWDVTTDALPADVLSVFSDCRVIETGIAHGTVTVLLDGTSTEITTFRVDGAYTDGRHPDSVHFTARVEDDLARRDFTVNAMAYNDSEGLLDPYGGQADLRARCLRCVGDAQKRFEEDALRLLRAVRFAAELGFLPEQETLHALRLNAKSIRLVAPERIFTEIRRTVSAPHAAEALRLAPELLFAAVPPLSALQNVPQNTKWHRYDVWEHTLHALQNAAPDLTVRLAVLFHDAGKAACRTTDESGTDHFYRHELKSAEIAEEALGLLRCDNRTKKDVLTLVRLHNLVFPMRPVKLRRLLSSIGYDLFYKLMEVCLADCSAQAVSVVETRKKELAGVLREVRALEKSDACLTIRQLHIGGRELLALGIEGPDIGSFLERLLADVMCNQVQNTAPALTRRALYFKRKAKKALLGQ